MKMTICLSGLNFNEILASCKSFAIKDEKRPALSQIELECDGSTVIATACDGVKAVRVQTPCMEGSDACTILIPAMFKPVGKAVETVHIMDDGKIISIYAGATLHTFKRINAEQIHVEAVFKGFREKTPQVVMYLNPTRAIEFFSAFKNRSKDAVKCNIYETKEGIVGFMLQGGIRKKALLMPVNPSSDPDKFDW